MANRLALMVTVAVVVIVLATVILHPFHTYSYLTINAGYVFLTPTGSGQFKLLYYDTKADLLPALREPSPTGTKTVTI
jgi:hypothetical protein